MSLLYNFGESAKTKTVRMLWPSDEYTLPAGTPMSETGIANGSDAIGILASREDVQFPYPKSVAPLVGKKEPKGNYPATFTIITAGFVNRTKAERALGRAYTDAEISAMSGINFVDERNPKSFGGASNWADIPGKPFTTVGGDTLTWDGNTEGRVSMAGELYKVSDAVPTIQDFANGATFTVSNGIEETMMAVAAEEIRDFSATEGFPLILIHDFVWIPLENNIELDGMVFPEKGIYVGAFGGVYVSSLTIPGYTGFPTEKINPEVLPGATVLYGDATGEDVYIHSTPDVTAADNRVTMSQMYGLLKSGRSIYLQLDMGVESYTASLISIGSGYGYMTAGIGIAMNNQVVTMAFYTAEYTGS